MADVNANIEVNIDASDALSQIRSLQRQISQFHTSISRSSEAAALAQRSFQTNLVNSINSLGTFTAEMRTVKTTAESFATSLEKNKFSMREYFRYAGASTKTFGRLFKSEYDTIGKVAEDRVRRLQTQYIKMGRDASGAMKAIAVIPNKLDMKNFATQAQMAAQKQALFNQLVKQGSTSLLNFGKNTQWAGRQLMVGFTIPLITMGAAASKSFMQMEQAVIKFRKVYGDLNTSAQEANEALAGIRSLGREFTKYGVAVADTISLASDAAAAGFKGLDLQRQTAQASRLAILGQIESQKALETTISLQNAFGTSSEQLAGSIDFLNAVENQTVTSLDDITTAIPKVAPVIKQLGGDVKDLAFFLTAMKEGGVNASEGANALKSGLASLINPSAKASEMLAKMGININGIVEANKGDLKGTVIAFARALDELDPLTRARAIEQLFGKFQFARLSTLFQNVIQDGNQASRVLELTSASAAELAITAERELGTVADSPMNKFKKSVEDLRAAMAPVGAIFLKTVTPLVEFGTKVLDKFNDLGDGTKKVLAMIVLGVAGLGPIFLMTFGLLANAFANAIKFGQLLRNGYLRLTGQSKTLGQTTQYMTTEQLDAAAAAASLEQSHARLTQQFNVERSAVMKLVAAYERAIAAASRFSMMNPGAMRTPFPKKYASGVTMVPGTGSGDTVPAMLTPGEAVIPKDMAKKYAPLIAGMVAGNIPGYESGLVPKGTARAHLTTPFESGSRQWNQGVDFAGLQQLAAKYPQFIKVVSNLIAELPQSLNILLEHGTASIEQFSSGWNSLENKMLGSVKAGGADVNDPKVKSALKQIESEIHDRVITLAKGTESQKVSDQLLAQATKEILAKYQGLENELGVTASALAKSATQVGQVRVQPRSTKAGVKNSDYIRQGIASGEFTTKGNYVYADNTQIARLKQSGGFRPADSKNPSSSYARRPFMATLSADMQKLEEQAETSGAAAGANLGTAFVRSARKAFKTGSPSKKTNEIGRDVAKGFEMGLKKGAGGVVAAADQIAAMIMAPLAGATQEALSAGKAMAGATQSQLRQASLGALYNSKDPDAELKSLRRYLDKERKRRIAAEKARIMAQKNAEELSAVLASQQDGSGATGSRYQKFKDRFKKNPNAAAEKKASAGTAGMAISGAVMALSMVPGSVGEAAQKAMLPIFALSAVLPLLTSVAGAAAVGVAALAAGIIFLHAKTKNAVRSGVELGNAVSMTSDKLRAMSQITGKVGATEIRKRQQEMQISGLTAKQQSFGQKYLGSDSGKSMLKDIEVMRNNKMSSKQIAQTMARNLSVAVMQGVITTEQAKSIAAALGEKLKDYGISASIRGDLVDLLGPNGENLLQDPLKIAVELQQSGQKNVQDLFQTAEDFTYTPQAPQGGPRTAAKGPNNDSWIVDWFKTTSDDGARQQRSLQSSAIQAAAQQIAINQEILDSTVALIDKDIEKAKSDILSAKNAKERAAAEERLLNAQNKRKDAIKQLTAENAKYLNSLYQYRQDVGKRPFDNTFNTVIDERVKNAEGARKAAIQAAQQGINSEKDSNFKTMLQVGFMSDQFSEATVNKLLGAATNNEDLKANFDLLVKQGGMANATQLVSLLDALGSSGETIDKVVKLSIDKTDGLTPEQITNSVAALGQLKEKYNFSISVEGDEGLKKIKEVAQQTKEFEKAFPNGTFDVKMLQSFADTTTDPLAKANAQWVIDNWQKLSGGKEKLSTEFLIDLVGMKSGEAEVVDQYLEGKGLSRASFAGLSNEIITKTYFIKAVEEKVAGETGDKPQTPPKGDGTGTKSNPWDFLKETIVQLRNTRNAAISTLNPLKALKDFLAGKFKINIFNGLEQQLTKVGVKGGFLDAMLGLSEEDFNKVKKTLFVIKNGMIVGLTAVGKAQRDFYNAAQVGKAVSEMRAANEEINNQISSYNKLRKAGFDAADAATISANATFAAAMASMKIAKGSQEWIKFKKILKDFLDNQKKGEFSQGISDLEKAISKLTSSSSAFQKLTNAGIAIAQAYRIAADESYAVLVNTARTAAELEKVVRLVNEYQNKSALKTASDQLSSEITKVLNASNAYQQLTAAKFSVAAASRLANDQVIAAAIAAAQEMGVLEQLLGVLMQIDDLTGTTLIESKEADLRNLQDQMDSLQKAQEEANRAFEAQKDALQDQSDLLDKQKEPLQAKLDNLREQNDELQRQEDFLMKQAELTKNQIEAKIRGDYIGAALIGQEKSFNTAAFNRATAMKVVESQIKAIDDQIKTIQDRIEVIDKQQRLSNKDFETRQRALQQNIDSVTKEIEMLKTSMALSLAQSSALKAVLDMIQNNPFFGAGVGTSTGSGGTVSIGNPVYGPGPGGSGPGGVLPAEYLDGFANGGVVRVNRYASGGQISGPGTSTSDSILGVAGNFRGASNGLMGLSKAIAVSNNEYILNAKAVDKYGVGMIDAINSGTYQPASSPTVYTDNSTYKIEVTGVSDPNKAADIVMQRLQTIKNKNNGSNKMRAGV